jgi:hypothetical protein
VAISFDGATSRIILDSASVTAAEIWSRWTDWHAANPEWPLAFRQVGGDDLGGGLSIPPYFFLQGAWRVRPMEASHNLTITGNLFVEGGGVPVVPTLGTFQVNVNYTVPVQAQGISTAGTTAPTAEENAAAVWAHASGAQVVLRLAEAWARLGLDASKPVAQSDTEITLGDLVLAITEASGTVTVTRQ